MTLVTVISLDSIKSSFLLSNGISMASIIFMDIIDNKGLVSEVGAILYRTVNSIVKYSTVLDSPVVTWVNLDPEDDEHSEHSPSLLCKDFVRDVVRDFFVRDCIFRTHFLISVRSLTRYRG
jgi:hypothetical protein